MKKEHYQSNNTNFINFWEASFLLSYNILYNIFLLKVTVYMNEILGDHQRRFQCNK